LYSLQVVILDAMLRQKFDDSSFSRPEMWLGPKIDWAQLSQSDRATRNVSWNLVKCCITVRKFPFAQAYNRCETLKLT